MLKWVRPRGRLRLWRGVLDRYAAKGAEQAGHGADHRNQQGNGGDREKDKAGTACMNDSWGAQGRARITAVSEIQAPNA